SWSGPGTSRWVILHLTHAEASESAAGTFLSSCFSSATASIRIPERAYSRGTWGSSAASAAAPSLEAILTVVTGRLPRARGSGGSAAPRRARWPAPRAVTWHRAPTCRGPRGRRQAGQPSLRRPCRRRAGLGPARRSADAGRASGGLVGHDGVRDCRGVVD